ncbi:MAG: hypothetical protein VX583_00645 [Bdellovibrionota bacterium]|nr:hypothetical protein [Pseudobdellovibrionaceae bacterium]
MKFLGFLLIMLSLQPAKAWVINGDDRMRIVSPGHDEARKIGYLEGQIGQYSSGCIGTNISDKYIITSAHCVIDTDTGKLIKQLVYYPRYVGKKTRSPSRVFIKEGYVLKDYVEALGNGIPANLKGERNLPYRLKKNNLALLRVFSDKSQKDVGQLYGWYGLGNVFDGFDLNRVYNVSLRSYPADKPLGSLLFEDFCYLMKDYGVIGKISCDTGPGAGGAAVIIKDRQNPRAGKVIGVYNTERYDEDQKVNNVVMITPELEKEIANIVTGKPEKNRLFQRVRFDTEQFHYFYVQNRCHKPINVAMRLQLTDNSWRTQEFYDIGYNERTEGTIESNNSIYYYFAKTLDGSMGWFDEVNGKQKKAFGRTEWFFRKEIFRENGQVLWGDHYTIAECE